MLVRREVSGRVWVSGESVGGGGGEGGGEWEGG